MGRTIDLDQLLQYPLRRKSKHCDEKNADPHFLNGVESVLEWAQTLPTLPQPSNEPRSPHPDGDTSIFACPRCGSGEYLYNEDGVWNNYCGQCGQRIGWGHPPDRRPPEGEDGDATRG